MTSLCYMDVQTTWGLWWFWVPSHETLTDRGHTVGNSCGISAKGEHPFSIPSARLQIPEEVSLGTESILHMESNGLNHSSKSH